MITLPLFPALRGLMMFLTPCLAYAVWKWGLQRLGMHDPAGRCRLMRMLAALPLLHLFCFGIEPHRAVGFPTFGLHIGFGPLQDETLRQHIFPGARPGIDAPPPGHPSFPTLLLPLLLLPVLHLFGILQAVVLGIAEYFCAVFRVARLPKRRDGNIFVLDVPGWAAFTFGLLIPRVFISEAVWNSPHREAVLAHERAHAARRDPLIRLLMQGARRLMWFVPFWKNFIAQIEIEAERACDIRACETVSRAAYARALLAFIEHGSPAQKAGNALMPGFHNALHAGENEGRLLARARALAELSCDATPRLFWPVFSLIYFITVILS